MNNNNRLSLSCKECEIQNISIFHYLSQDDIDRISNKKVTTIYKKGQLIFYERNYPNGIYCIQIGKVKVYKIGASGKEQIVRLASTGDVLGYRALIADEPYTASGETLETSRVCFIPKHIFYELLENNLKFNRTMLRLLSNDLKIAERKITNLAYKQVKERLAGAILFLKEKYGLEEDNATLNLSMTRDDLANLVGTATESVIRYLQEMKNEKIIILNKRKIKILNQNALMKVANIYE